MKELENNNVNQVIPVSEMDLQELAILINERYKTKSKPVIINTNKFNQEIKNKSPKWRYNSFLVLLNKFPRAWEYDYIPQKKGEKVGEYGDRLYKELNESLPVDIRNSGDEQVIRDYILQNDGKWTDPKEEWGVVKQVLPIKAKARLIKRLETLEKKKQNQELAEARKAGVDPFNDRPKFVVNKKKVDTLTDQQKNGRILLDVHMPLYQTSGNGCWSCSMQMLMQGRGVKNITQEDIRSYRPNYGKQMMQGEKFTTKHVIDKAFNTDDTQNVMDMGDAAVNLVPDSMLRTLDILKISDAETAMYKKFTPEEKTAYKKNAVELFKKTIRKVLTEDKSPLSITDGFHYVTIVGIDGNNMLVKSSTASPYDKEYPENIENYVTKLLEGRHKCQLVWMTDINLAKDNTHFYGVPSETLELNPDGTYKMPPLVINVAANENRAEQEYEGFRVRLYAGKEDTRNEQADRPLLVDGVVKVEQAYMPKKLNVEHLKAMAKERSDIEEDRLKNQTIELLGYDPTKKRPEKKQGAGKDYDVRGGFKLENIKEDDKREVYADDTFVTGKNKGKDGEKGDNVIDNREERTREKLFNPFSFSVGRDRDERIREAEERVNSAIGLNKKNHLPDVDQNGKEYIWNLPGADIAFRLEAGVNLARKVLTAMGPGKAKKLKEIEERYAKLKAKLNSPANRIKKEDNLSGYAGDGVILPSGLEIKGIFKDRVDRFEAVMLLDTISNSVSISDDLHQQRLTDYTANSYNPSAISRATENMQMICDYQAGNLLRGAGKNVGIKESIEKVQRFPENANLEELNKAFNNPDIQLDMTGYIVTGIEAKSAIDEEYRTANTQFVGPAPKVPEIIVENIGINPTGDLNINQMGINNEADFLDDEPEIEVEEPKKENEPPKVEEEPKKEDEPKKENEPPKVEEKKGREIGVADANKKIDVLGTKFGYKEFTDSLVRAGFDKNTANAIFNIYNIDMVPYIFPVLESAGTESKADDELQILALRGVTANAGSVKGKINKDSLAHINSTIYRKTANWEKEHNKKFETGDHSGYGFFGKGKDSGKEDKNPKKEDPKGEEEPKKEEPKVEPKGEEVPKKDEEPKKEEPKGEEVPKKDEEPKVEEKVDEDDFDFVDLVNEDYRYAIINGEDEDVLTKYQLNKLNNEADLYVTGKELADKTNAIGQYLIHDQFKNQKEADEMIGIYTGFGCSPTRPYGVVSLFTIWAMGEVGYSYSSAIRLLDNLDGGAALMVEQFNQFCRDNQITSNENDPVKYKESIKNWARVHANAANKMKEFKLPDIDYKDPHAFDNIKRELFMISILGVNANQDMIPLVFNEGKCTTDTARNIAIEAMGSEKAYMEMSTFWYTVQQVGGSFQNAYLPMSYTGLSRSRQVIQAKTTLGNKVHDYFLREKLNKVRGKKLGEATSALKTDGFIVDESVKNMMSDEMAYKIPPEVMIDYATGTNKQPFVEEVERRKGPYVDETHNALGKIFTKAAKKIFVDNGVHNKAIAEAFLNAPDDAEGRRKFLNTKDQAGVTYKTHITSLFGGMMSAQFWNAIQDTDYRVSELFLIGGKTADELWGKKYEHVQDPEEKEWLLRSEIYKASVRGDRDIQMRAFTAGKDNKFKETGVRTILPDKSKVEKAINALDTYKAFVKQSKYVLSSYADVIKKSAPEDTKELRDLSKQITDLDTLLTQSVEGSNISFDSIRAEFARLAAVGGAYIQKSNDPTSVIHIMANTMNNFCQGETHTLNTIEKDLAPIIALDPADTLAKPSYKNVSNAVNDLEKYYEKTLEFNRTDEHERIHNVDYLREQDLKDADTFAEVQKKLAKGENLTPDEVKVLDRKFDFFKFGEKSNQATYVDQLKVMQGNENDKKVRSDIFNAAGFQGTREETMYSICVLWVMGHKGYDLQSAIKVLHGPNSDQLISEFVQFCKDNPMNPLKVQGIKPDKYKASAENWAGIMKKSTELIKNYVIPDIDYNDTEAVRNIFAEIEVMRGLTINAKQEFDRLCHHTIPGGLGDDNVQYAEKKTGEYIFDYLGGDTAFKEITNTWKGLQQYYDGAYASQNNVLTLNPWDNGSAYTIKRNLAIQAVHTYFLRNDFKHIKGMKVGDIPVSLVNTGKTEGDIRSAVIMASILFGENLPDSDSVINYLTGKDTKTFEAYLEKEFLSPKMKEARSGFVTAPTAQAFAETVYRKADTVLLVNSLENNAEAKKDFAKNNRSIIDDTFVELIPDDLYRIAKSMGINVLDLIRIDGKTPTELWGDTYKDVADPIEKNYLFKTELLKAAFGGESEIQLQKVGFDENFNYTPGGMFVAMPKRNEISKMAEAFDIMEGAINDIHAKVNMYYQRLKVTQKDPNNNFKNDVGEGSQPYREMCHHLVRLSYYLGRRNSDEFKMSEFRKRLDAFRKAADAYYKRGKTSNRERLNVAGDASTEMDNLLRVYDDAFAVIDKGYAVNGAGTAIKDAALSGIRNRVISFCEAYGKTEPIPRMNAEQVAQKKGEALERNNALRLYENKLSEAMGKSVDTSKKMSTEEVARLCVYKNLKDKISRPGITVEEIEARTENVTKDVINDGVSELKDNKVFKVIAAKYQTEAPAKWDDILQKTYKYGAEFRSFAEEHRGDKGLDYIKNDPNIKLSAKKNVKYVDKYDRLGEVVAKQILSTTRNIQLLQGLAAGQFEYKDLQSACTDYFRKQNALDAASKNFISDEMLKTKLDNGTLKADVLKKVAEPMRKMAEQRTKQEEIEKKNAEISAKMKENNPSRR